MGLEIINQLKKKKGLTTEDLSGLSGVPLGTLNKILSGITTDPKLETIKAIARALNCTLDDFDDEVLDDTKINASFTSTEQTHIKKYRKLDAHGKEVIDFILDSEAKRIDAMAAETPTKVVAIKDSSPLAPEEDAPYVPETLAAHYDGDELTEEALSDIERFKREFVAPKNKK